MDKVRKTLISMMTAAGIAASVCVGAITPVYSVPMTAVAPIQESTTVTPVTEIPIIPEAGVDPATVATVANTLNTYLTPGIKKAMVEHGVTVNIIRRESPVLATYPDKKTADGWAQSPMYIGGGGGIPGTTLYYKIARPPIIYLFDDQNTESLKCATLHEVGHILDYIFQGGLLNKIVPESQPANLLSSTQDWKTIHATELQQRILADSRFSVESYNIKETFAQSFSAYFLHHDAMQKNAPMSTQYIANVIASFDTRLNK